jgi:hypothetical protein
MVNAGHIVFFRFGHNDRGLLDDAAIARGTLRGIDDKIQEIETRSQET